MNKKLKLTALIMLILIFLTSGGVFANFQSSPNVSRTRKNLEGWLLGIRQMEASGQVMGLNETLGSTSSLTSSGYNNIDVHLQKNTEYGAMLILAVSDYGKQGNGTSRSEYISDSTYGLATTTGNASGIYNISNAEYVAGGVSDNTYSKTLYSVSSKYKDSYTSQGIFGSNEGNSISTNLGKTIAGDGMDIATWQGESRGYWLYAQNPRSTIVSSKYYPGCDYYYYWVREGFGYKPIQSYKSTWSDTGELSNTTTSGARAVVVCGDRF